MKDKTGREIRVDDHIAYAVTRGRSGYLKLGVVVEVLPSDEIKVDCAENMRPATLSFSDRVVILP